MIIILESYIHWMMKTGTTGSMNLFNITKWHALGNPTLTPEQFKNDPCWIGLDFAPRNDFSSRCLLLRREQEDGTHYYAFWKHFLSEGKVDESENASYKGWAREGWIATNEGNQTNPDVIEDDIEAIYADGYQVQELDADPSRVQGMEHMLPSGPAAWW